MNLRKKLRMNDQEYVLTAWPESVNGPGCSNHLLNVVIRDRGADKIRIAYLQPDEWYQVENAHALAGVAEASHRAFAGAFIRASEKRSGAR